MEKVRCTRNIDCFTKGNEYDYPDAINDVGKIRRLKGWSLFDMYFEKIEIKEETKEEYDLSTTITRAVKNDDPSIIMNETGKSVEEVCSWVEDKRCMIMDRSKCGCEKLSCNADGCPFNRSCLSKESAIKWLKGEIDKYGNPKNKKEFKVGKWYKTSVSDKTYLAKLLSFDRGKMEASEFSLEKSYHRLRYVFGSGYEWAEATFEDMEKCLPKGHPDILIYKVSEDKKEEPKDIKPIPRKPLSDYDAVHVDSQEKWDFVSSILGYMWKGRLWSELKEKNCINIKYQGYGVKEQYYNNVVSFEEWLDLTGHYSDWMLFKGRKQFSEDQKTVLGYNIHAAHIPNFDEEYELTNDNSNNFESSKKDSTFVSWESESDDYVEYKALPVQHCSKVEFLTNEE